MFRRDPTIDNMRRDAYSNDQATRGQAMQSLYLLARKDPRVHDAALAVFRDRLTSVPDGWTATSAARGIEVTGGAGEGRAAWRTLSLLRSPGDHVGELRFSDLVRDAIASIERATLS